ncbi:unnamed protein product [Rotaria sp. Silwood2]|nr:unnamed protein product [Rotaria sp. Silwood2]CAF3865713.1 unnamed protein product [Rotaria sp. Silwood2]CAF4180079.1 unnamed protein product [Rotaria sp. Silwood2]
MNTVTIFLTITTSLLSVSLSANLPNWLGTFNIDNSCNQAECCCLDEEATIVKINESQLLITANVAGLPCQAQLNGSTTVSVPLPIPQDKNGFQITTSFLGTLNRFTLSADSQYIAHSNLQYPRCSGSAQRVVSNWLGTFNVDDSCDQNQCCCLSEQATITKISDTQLLVSAYVAGEPCQAQLNGSRTIEVPIPIPKDKNGFQITTIFLGTMNRFTLTYDNQYIANVNLQYPRCSGMGRRM